MSALMPDSLPPLRPGTLASAALVERRRTAIAGMPSDPPPGAAVAIGEVDYGGIGCIVCEPAAPRLTIIHFHGGGYRMGAARGWVPFAARLADQTRARVVVPDYRLAPEHPFPAALHDAVSVHAALADTPIVLSGDSAGGGLAAALASLVRPRGVVLLSPWLDLTVTAGSFVSRAGSDALFSKASAQEAASQYLQGHSAEDPLASPLFADPSGFPPTLLFASADESLLDDTMGFAARLAEARVPVETHIVPGMPHVWPVIAPQSPKSALVFEVIARFVGGI